MRPSYTVIIYDESGNRVAGLSEAGDPSYNRARNSADQISVKVPRKDSRIGEVKIGRRFEVIRVAGGTEEIEESGFISEHGYSGDWYEINGFTEEIFLSRYLTPVNYGYPFYSEAANLAELFTNFQNGFEVVRIKRDWSTYRVDGSNEDFTSEPEIVLLTKNGTHPPSGYITFRFTKAASETWDRFRWVSDYDEKSGVTTTVQYRTAADVGSLGGFSNPPQAGLLTDIVGIVPGSRTDNVLEVRVNFETTNPDLSPVLYSFEVIKRTAQIISVDYSTYATVDPVTVSTTPVEANNRNLLEILIDACEAVDWEFRVRDGILYLSEDLGVDRTNTYTLVES